VRLGSIQRDIMRLVERSDPEIGVFLGSTCKAEELRGLDWQQVDRAAQALVRRGILRREGIRFIKVRR
jgi:hypothetical protein